MTQEKNQTEGAISKVTRETASLGTDPSTDPIRQTKDDAEMMHSNDATEDSSGIVLDERIQAQIGQQLSSFYRDLVNQPIPQNFMDLLSRLDRQEDGK
jgi:hypothetical protein